MARQCGLDEHVLGCAVLVEALNGGRIAVA